MKRNRRFAIIYVMTFVFHFINNHSLLYALGSGEDNSMSYSISVGKDKLVYEAEKKSVTKVILMDMVPITTVLSAQAIYWSTLPYEAKQGCEWGFIESGLVLIPIGTIPSHIYVGTKFITILGLTVSKIYLYSLPYTNTVDGDFFSLLLSSFSLSMIIYTSEIFYHVYKVKKYNEKLNQREGLAGYLVPKVRDDGGEISFVLNF